MNAEQQHAETPGLSVSVTVLSALPIGLFMASITSSFVTPLFADGNLQFSSLNATMGYSLCLFVAFLLLLCLVAFRTSLPRLSLTPRATLLGCGAGSLGLFAIALAPQEGLLMILLLLAGILLISWYIITCIISTGIVLSNCTFSEGLSLAALSAVFFVCAKLLDLVAETSFILLGCYIILPAVVGALFTARIRNAEHAEFAPVSKLEAMHHQDKSVLLSIGMFGIFFLILPNLLAHGVAVPLNLTLEFNESPLIIPVTTLLASLSLLVVFLMLFLHIKQRSEATQQAKEYAPLKACEELGHKNGLTDREIEVMKYVYQGYSVKKIAESCFIATSTVQGHTKKIYTKLGVHSRQELIDLVNTSMR